MRKRIAALVLAVALVASLPCRAIAETPVQFYNNLAQTVGVAVDVGSQAWQDKTKAAYLAYLDQEMPHNVNTPTRIYAAGLKLEELTNYDVVYAENGSLYMNTAMEGTGGAFRGIECTYNNFSALLLELSKWLRLAVENGPEWPYSGTQQPEPEGQFPSVLNLAPAVGAMDTEHVSVESVGSLTVNVDSSLKTTIDNKMVTYPYYVVVYGTNGQTSTGQIYVILGKQPLTVAYEVTTTNYGGNLAYRANIETSSDYTYATQSIKINLSTKVYNLSSLGSWHSNNYSSLTKTAQWKSGGSGIVIPPATDNNPPEHAGDTNITINWPDITYTGPTYNYEGDTYGTTSGDIDWSPVTSRLDEMAEQFELFANSFESLRADLLQYWDKLGDALQDVSDQITTTNNRLNSIIDWLINIFNKQDSGPQSTQPNPDTDEGGFWEWLGRLLDKLLGNLPEGLTDFSNALGQLTGRFPFSVPWDMAALLGLFSHEPVTPNVTFYLPTVTRQGFAYDAQTAVPLTIDCTGYDDVAFLARRLELITFAILLAKWTIDGLKGIDWSLFG